MFIFIVASSNLLAFLTSLSFVLLHRFLMCCRFSIVFPVLYPFLEFSTSASLSSGFPILMIYLYDYLSISIIVLFSIYVIIYANIYICNYLILFFRTFKYIFVLSLFLSFCSLIPTFLYLYT